MRVERYCREQGKCFIVFFYFVRENGEDREKGAGRDDLY